MWISEGEAEIVFIEAFAVAEKLEYVHGGMSMRKVESFITPYNV